MPFSAKACCIAVAVSLALAGSPALAQQHTTRYELDLPEQALADSLRALGKAAHINIVFDPAAVAGKRAPMLSGEYTPAEALGRLLAGSGLSARATEGGSYAVEASPASTTASAGEQAQYNGDTVTFDPLKVYGKVEGFSATRMPTALKDIPQSVSVIDQQTLREQNANDLAKAFNWITGVTLWKIGAENSVFYSRGFQIDTIHVDGGAPLWYAVAQGQMQRIDLSQYERVEILRGADALFGGVGQPGGSINLMRKRPLPENAVSLTASAGSWDHYRVEADLSAKLSDDGRLRGRLVAVNESEHYFYDTAERRMSKLYAVGEYDLRPGTLVTLGGSYQRTPDFIQFANGLPRYGDGRDSHLPRSWALTFPWAKNSSTSKEGFAQLEQSFGERWKLKAGVTRTEQDQDLMAVYTNSSINPVTRTINGYRLNSGRVGVEQTMTDVTLTGGFDWNGRKQEVVIGFDRMRSDVSNRVRLVYGPLIDPFRFDPATYAAPTTPGLTGVSKDSQQAHGIFASVKLRPAEGWAITAGARNSFSRTISHSRFVDTTTSSVSSDSGVITPFLAAVYEINPTYSLYASYADVTQVSSDSRTASGALLDPPRGTNQELGLKGSSRSGRLNGSLALFNIQQINVPVRDPLTLGPSVPNCCYVPTIQRSKGIEAELNGQLAPGWQLSAGYTFNINRQGDGSTLSTVTPKHLLKLWSTYQPPGPAQSWSVGGGITAQSRNYRNGRVCSAFNPSTGHCAGAFGPYRTEQGFYMVATLRAGYRLNDRWDLALNVDNLFDRRYYSTIGIPFGGNFYGEPRNWTLTLRGEF